MDKMKMQREQQQSKDLMNELTLSLALEGKKVLLAKALFPLFLCRKPVNSKKHQSGKMHEQGRPETES